VPGLGRRYLPVATIFVPTRLAIQAASGLLAVWARRHLGRNWSAAITVAVDQQLVRSGPYRVVRHPIYSAMLGMFIATAVVSGEWHALVAVAIIGGAYWRKIRLEEQTLGKVFWARVRCISTPDVGTDSGAAMTLEHAGDTSSMTNFVRSETDPLGPLDVPADAYYGVQTRRAALNFPISGLKPLAEFVRAVVWIKKAAALTHKQTGRLDARLADAIVAAADEVLAGTLDAQFIVDVYQAGAGTSHNMNCNEVLANRANELLGGKRGDYKPVHPNDHVNMAQSTNDVIPTAIRLGVLALVGPFTRAFEGLREALAAKGVEFDDVLKSGRTHLQDAMPIRLGQEFAAYAGTIQRNLARVQQAADFLRDLGIGGSAVGTGVNVEPEYPALMNGFLRQITGLDVRIGADPVQLMQSMGDAAAFSSAVKVLALELSKIASDLRLMASGPRTGLDEIVLPAVQPGSSIMPGKINPSIPEMVNQVSFQVVGNDACVAAAAEHGQLELNVMMPVIAHNLMFSMIILTNAATVFSEACVKGITANREQCEYWVERSAALATALAPRIGYAKAAEISKRSVKENVLIRDLVKRDKVLPPKEIDDVLDLRKMTEIGVPGGRHGGGSVG
jgi:aspartate ammonia-lyase